MGSWINANRHRLMPSNKEKENQRRSDQWDYLIWMIHWGGALLCKAILALLTGYILLRSILT